jgi:hypothetical protein
MARQRETKKKRRKIPRKKAIAKMASIKTDLSEVGPSSSGLSTLVQISET